MPDVFLYPGEANPSDVKLRDPTVAGAGHVVNTLTANPGQVDITGTNAGALATRRVTASSGSLVIVGTNAGVIANRRVTASAGAVTVTGTSATVKTQRFFTLSPGVVTVTGANVGVLPTRRLTASNGSVAITGTSATVKAQRVVTASAGSAVIAGTNAGTATTRRVTASSGTVVIAGTSAAVIAHRTFTMSPGSVVIAGTSANLYRAFIFGAQPGAVVVSGTSAGLIAHRLITASAGSITIAGTNARVAPTRRLTAQPGSAVITGTVAGVIAHRLLTLSPGSVIIAGTSAGVADRHTLTASVGALVISGTAANVTYTPATGPKTITAQPGQVRITGAPLTTILKRKNTDESIWRRVRRIASRRSVTIQVTTIAGRGLVGRVHVSFGSSVKASSFSGRSVVRVVGTAGGGGPLAVPSFVAVSLGHVRASGTGSVAVAPITRTAQVRFSVHVSGLALGQPGEGLGVTPHPRAHGGTRVLTFPTRVVSVISGEATGEAQANAVAVVATQPVLMFTTIGVGRAKIRPVVGVVTLEAPEVDAVSQDDDEEAIALVLALLEAA